MKYDRNSIENFVAEVVARFLLGAIGAFVAMTFPFWFGAGWTVWSVLWETLGWWFFAIPVSVGVFYALFGIRRGPSDI